MIPNSNFSFLHSRVLGFSFISKVTNFLPLVRFCRRRKGRDDELCQNLINKPKQSSNETSPFVLIVRGGCSFEDKVRKAGSKAAIIHDNEVRGIMVASGIRIHAVFVTKETGEALKESAGLPDAKVWLLPSFKNSAWSIMAVSFISLLVISAVIYNLSLISSANSSSSSPPRSL